MPDGWLDYWVAVFGLFLAEGGEGQTIAGKSLHTRTEEVLRVREQVLAAIADNIPAIVYRAVVHSDGSLTLPYISAGSREVSGVAPVEAMGDPLVFFGKIHPEDRAQVDENLRLAAENLQSIQQIFRLISASGQVKWVQDSARVHRAENGDAIVDGVMLDITASQWAEEPWGKREAQFRDRVEKAEEKLKQNEARLAETEAIAHIGSWELDVATQAIACSDEVFRILGIEPKHNNFSYSDFLGRILREDRNLWEKAAELAIQGCPFEVECRIVQADGSVRYACTRGKAIFNEVGQVIKLFGSLQDITTGKQAEANFRETQKFIEAILNTNPCFVFIYDLLENRNLYANHGVVSILGYTPEQVQQMNPSQLLSLIHPEDRAAVSSRLEQIKTAENSEVWEIEYRVRHANGEWHWVYDRATVFKRTTAGQVWQIAGSAYDITKRKQAQLALQQTSAELEQQVADRNAAYEELYAALEELEVAEEELRCQNQELKQARQSAEYLQKNYQDLFDGAPDGYAVTDARGVIQEANQAIASLLSKDKKFLVGKPLSIFIPLQERKTFRSLLDRLNAKVGSADVPNETPSQPAETCEFFLQSNSESQPFPAAISVTACRDSQGNLQSLRWMIRDITERFQAEEMVRIARDRLEITVQERTAELSQINASLQEQIQINAAAEEALWQSLQRLEETSRLLQNVLETLPVGVWIADVKGRIWQWNSAAEKIWGGARYVGLEGYDEYKGWWAETGDRIKASEWGLYRAIAFGETSLNEVIDIEGFDGTRKTILNSAMPLRNENQEIVGAIAVNQDITEQRLVEKALWENQRLIQQIADAMPNILYLHDAIGRQNIYVNRAISDILGYSPEEIQQMKQSVMELFHPDDQSRLAEHEQQLAASADGEIFEIDYRMRHKSGEWRWLSSRDVVFARNAEGLPAKILGTAVDLTSKIQAESALRENQQLLQAILDNSPAVIYIKDNQGRYILANHQYKVLTNVTNVQLAGKTDWDIFPRAAADKFVSNDRMVLEAGAALEFEEIVPLADGLHTYLALKFPLYNSAGIPYAVCGISTDITARKQAEAALKESEQRFRIMADAAPVFIWMGDTEALCTFFNKPWLDFRGRTLAEELGNGWVEGVHPEDRERCLNTYLSAFNDRAWFQNEYRLRRADGEYRWILDTGVALYSPSGEFIGYIGSGLDITDRKLAEEALRTSEEKFRQLAENIQEVFWMSEFDSDRMIYVNAAYEQIWGRSCASLYANPESWVESLHPEDRDRVLAYRANNLFIEFEQEYRIVRPDGSERWIWDRSFPIRNPAGDVYRRAGLARDITERKHIQEALRLSEERLRIAIQSSPIVLFNQDLDLRYTWVLNPQLGLYGEAILGKTDADILLPAEAERLTELKRRVLATGTGVREEVLLTCNEEVFYYDLTIEPLRDTAGNIVGITCVAVDISDRKQAEEIRRALETQKELSQLQLRFFSMASHEFRTPLSTILLSAQLLQTCNAPGHEAKRLNNIYRIQNCAKNMTHLLEDILTITRAETGRLEFKPQLIDVERFCQQLLEELQVGEAFPYNIDFVCHKPSLAGADPEAPRSEQKIIASLDEKLLRSILANLLSNAKKYSLVPSSIYLMAIRELDEITFQVRDEGIGIPKEDHKQLFEAFHRGKNVGSIPGSGLGLTVVKKCVELHGGTIAFTSEIGKGTTFTVTIPQGLD